MLSSLLFIVTHASADFEPLFNGKDLKGWTPKFAGYDAGVNFANTFRVQDGKIIVSYDGYGGEFKNRFGHLFYKETYSAYILRVEYRFVGSQCPGGPGWAYKNSGIMFHGQTPQSMGKDQPFPVSSEFQFLGADIGQKRASGNLCTPGTHVILHGKLHTPHVTEGVGPSIAGKEWVKAELEVQPNGTIIHRINGVETIRYSGLQLDPNDETAKPLIKDGVLAVTEGTISLQSESHPIEFRNIEIKQLP